MITTDAWVLLAGPSGGGLSRRPFTFADLRDDEVLVEPLYGSWEANIDHAVSRSPVDVCRQRGEDAVVLGNLGVVRVLRTGSAPAAEAFTAGDVCMVMPFGQQDRYGYAELVYAYDMPGTVGLLAKQTKVAAHMLLPVPAGGYSLSQWTTYARYFTAWDNWRVAYHCWQCQLPPDVDPGQHLVFGWGGGVAVAELELARRAGFRVAMTAGSDTRLAFLKERGITPVDRRSFPDLAFDPALAAADSAYAHRYRSSEKEFLRIVDDLSDGGGVAVFVDNLGGPLVKATLKALAREGVLTTVGWKNGMATMTRRASECIKRHIHVNTHVWRFHDSPGIRDYQAATGWIPEPQAIDVVGFEDVPQLAEDFAAGRLSSYFPVFQINPV